MKFRLNGLHIAKSTRSQVSGNVVVLKDTLLRLYMKCSFDVNRMQISDVIANFKEGYKSYYTLVPE